MSTKDSDFESIKRFLERSRDAVMAVIVENGTLTWANKAANDLLSGLCKADVLDSCRVEFVPCAGC